MKHNLTAESHPHPGHETGSSKRLLWLTDTFGDHNGVSTVLKAILQEIRMRDLPVDLLVCSHSLQPEDHLLVVRPVTEFTLPMYRQQPVRIPNYISVQRVFKRGNYSRVICSTEGPMGLAALWLKKYNSVEVSFFLHTDWLTFAREVLSFEETGLGRLQKILRMYYRSFNKIFVLNTDQQQWLTGEEMGYDPGKVFLTAHWVDDLFGEQNDRQLPEFPFNTAYPVILYAGRISREKGVLDLPGIVNLIRSYIPEIQMVVAGTGPAEEELKKLMPDAIYTGWVDHGKLSSIFTAADILLLPSRFDTFSCAVLEALSCGLPVAAYNTKGPKDILRDSVSGFLAETPEEMAGKVIGYLLDSGMQQRMKEAAVERAGAYQAGPIMDQLLADLGMAVEPIHHDWNG